MGARSKSWSIRRGKRNSSRLPLVDVNGLFGRLALAPIAIEVGDAGQLGEGFLIDPLPAGRRARLPAEDGERGIADDFRRAPLRAVRHFPIDGSLGLDD